LLLNKELRTWLDLLLPDVKGRVEEAQEKQRQYDDRHSQARDLTVGEQVIARNFRVGPHWMPSTIVRKSATSEIQPNVEKTH